MEIDDDLMGVLFFDMPSSDGESVFGLKFQVNGSKFMLTRMSVTVGVLRG